MKLRKRNKIWTAVLRVNGKAVWKTTGERDRTLALMKARRMQEDALGRDNILGFNPIQFSEFHLKYLEFSSRTKSRSSSESERFTLEKFKRFLGRSVYLHTIDASMADRFQAHLAEAHEPTEDERRHGKRTRQLQPASVNHYMTDMRTVFNYALRWGHIEKNPFQGMRKMKVESRRARILSPDEILRFFAVARELYPQTVPLFHFLLFTGLRRIEALQLQWQDVNFETGELYVYKTKSKKPREVPFGPAVQDLLLGLRSLPQPFPGIHPNTVTERYHTIAVRAGIEGSNLHGLRKTYTSYMQQYGMPPLMLKWIVGHQSELTTGKFYTGKEEDFIRKIVEDFERGLSKNVASA